jgi:glycosyltransferase involved in cell wall biosynthesis
VAPLRVVLNTRTDDAAARLGIRGLAERLREHGVDATTDDWNHYEAYDVAVFLGYDHDLDAAKTQNPAIRVALVDPKVSRADWAEAARRADFLMVGSVEQRDAFLRVNRNVVVYYMFPIVAAEPRQHEDREPLVIGYHGNRVHLETMVANVRPALEELGRQRSVEFHAIYNHATLGRAGIGMPDDGLVTVRHIQWTDGFMADLRRADIGIVPNELPIRDRQRILREAAYDEPQFAYEPFDHLVRFKLSSNPGRLFPFASLAIPVVADFTPSSSQFVQDGVSGYVASSAHGWLDALERLAASAEHRATLGQELRRRMLSEYERQVDVFLDWCTRPLSPPPVVLPNVPTVQDELAFSDRYAAPSSPWTWRRVRTRAKRLLRR